MPPTKTPKNQSRPPLRPLLKWTGGKRSEIPFLRGAYPKDIQRVVEPFSGGAAVAFDLNAPQTILNDLSAGLVAFYRIMQDRKGRAAVVDCISQLDALRKKIGVDVEALSDAQVDAVFAAPVPWLERLQVAWLSHVPAKMKALIVADLLDQLKSKVVKRIPALEKKRGHRFTPDERRQHLETGLQAGVYTAARRVYNNEVEGLPNAWQVACWWFVRALCYSGMFRYGSKGNFNVPYGGIGYNSRDFSGSIKHLLSDEVASFFERGTVCNLDFEELFRQNDYFKAGDFIFIDPPYDSTFSQYNHDGSFGRQDQERLAKTLKKTKAPWMLVIKNTPFILSLYQGKGLYRGVFDKNYQVNFRNRHDRAAEHLVVTNYPFEYAEAGHVGIQREADN